MTSISATISTTRAQALPLADAVRAYEEYITWQAQLSPATRRSYHSDLALFVSWIQTHGDPDATLQNTAALEILEAFLQARARTNALGPGRLKRLAAVLKSFFRWAHDRGMIPSNPTRQLATPRLARSLPVHATADESQALIAASTRPHDSPASQARDHAAIVTLLTCGLRAGELCRLTWRNVDQDRRYLHVTGKGGHQREVPLPPIALGALKALHSHRVNGTPHVFTGRGTRPLSIRSLQRHVLATASRAGLDHKHITPHKLRHTYATLLSQKNVSIRTIQVLLGHASIATTEIYTHVAPTQLQEATKALHFLRAVSS